MHLSHQLIMLYTITVWRKQTEVWLYWNWKHKCMTWILWQHHDSSLLKDLHVLGFTYESPHVWAFLPSAPPPPPWIICWHRSTIGETLLLQNLSLQHCHDISTNIMTMYVTAMTYTVSTEHVKLNVPKYYRWLYYTYTCLH